MAQITTAEFAAQLETDGRTARKFLRSITPQDEWPGKGARWVLEGNKREITKMKKRFAEWTASQAEKPAKVEEAPVETDEADTDAVGLDDMEPTEEDLELEG